MNSILKNIFTKLNEVISIVEKANAEKEKINNNDMWSGNYKLQLTSAIDDETIKTTNKHADEIEEAIENWKKEQKKRVDAYDITDGKLEKAIKALELGGDSLTDEAEEKIACTLRGRPVELRSFINKAKTMKFMAASEEATRLLDACDYARIADQFSDYVHYNICHTFKINSIEVGMWKRTFENFEAYNDMNSAKEE